MMSLNFVLLYLPWLLADIYLHTHPMRWVKEVFNIYLTDLEMKGPKSQGAFWLHVSG